MITNAIQKLRCCQISLATAVAEYNSMIVDYVGGRESRRSLCEAHEKMLDSAEGIALNHLAAHRDDIDSLLCSSNTEYVRIERYADPRSSIAPMIEELSYTESGEVLCHIVSLLDMAIEEMTCPCYMAKHYPSETSKEFKTAGPINPASASPCLDEAVDMLTLLLN